LNLIAGRRAKNSAAYESALKYLRAGRSLLTEDTWARSYELAFSIEYLMAECEILTADMPAAESRLLRLVGRTNTRHDLCIVTRLQLTLYTASDQSNRGVEVFLSWLRQQGTVWSNHPSREDAQREYERIWILLGNRRIEELVDLPIVTDTEFIDTMDVFTEIVTPTLFYDANLFALVLCRMVNLSLENGNCDGSCFGYAWFSMLAGPQFNNYRDGYRFGQLGFDLVETRGLTRYRARTYITFGNAVVPWARHAASERELVRRAFDLAYRAGDLTFAAYRGEQLTANYLVVGDHLAEVQSEAENGLAFGLRVGFGYVIHVCGAQLGLIRTLRGSAQSFGSLNYDSYSESEAERSLASNPMLSLAEFCYWTRKMQARFFAGDFPAAIEASMHAYKLLWSAPSQIVTADFRFYAALAHVAGWQGTRAEERASVLEGARAHHQQLEIWAEHCPANFAERTMLIRAEIARIEGRLLDAQDCYEQAIKLASSNGSVHNEAIANELAGKFYAERNLLKSATAYLRDARACYLRWGAEAKARHLAQQFPEVAGDNSSPEGATTISAPVEHLDLATVMKISEALSGEIVLDKLIDTLMRKAIEHAGAERGLLILPSGDKFRIEVEATTGSEKIRVETRHTQIGVAQLPMSVFRYALRTRETVLIHDAVGHGQFSADEYIRQRQAKSVLCLPILKQTRLLGMLYLENNLTPRAFTPSRMAVLKLLASEAAVSIENARLYQDLGEREARIRRLVDANIIGIIICDIDGRILEANDAFLRIVGYDREDLVSQRISWTEMTPPEWRERDQQQLVPELKLTGSLQPFEKEFFRKDGSRVPVLVGVANFEKGGYQGVAFVLDLTERKRAADALRTLQMQLARANRIATMGQLTASISHEINQPIGATRNNANAALRFLSADPPDIGEARDAIESVVRETYRAGEILGGIRDQVKNTPPRLESVELNEAISEVMALVRGELLKHEVAVEMHLAEGLLHVRADRVQLQQVVLNLILNAIEALAGVDGKARELVVRSEPKAADTLMVSVQDSGPGISARNRERIFESFFTTKAGGVGIGLSICRSIIDSHGGRLWVDAHESGGAVFRFTLPVCK
jgi:PAS domain S-box-containing protein